jgi:SAM-dependent methyltransferase
MQQTPAHTNYNPILLDAMPAAKSIVEVGCSTGMLARAYRQLHPTCSYIGVELDAGYAEAARSHCHRVIVGNIEILLQNAAQNLDLHAEGFVFGDCLEHLYDPWCVLNSLKSLIQQEGWVCACIPNMQYYGIQAKLNRGDLFYEENGHLDRTHIRWFSRKTMIHLFESSGYRIEHIQPVYVANQQDEIGAKLVAIMANAQGYDPHQAARDALPFQYVIRARPMINSI